MNSTTSSLKFTAAVVEQLGNHVFLRASKSRSKSIFIDLGVIWGPHFGPPGRPKIKEVMISLRLSVLEENEKGNGKGKRTGKAEEKGKGKGEGQGKGHCLPNGQHEQRRDQLLPRPQ